MLFWEKGLLGIQLQWFCNVPYFYVGLNFVLRGGQEHYDQRVGVNALKNILPELSKKSAIPVWYTNHSLWATAITRMFHAEVEEKVIAETSGHRSLKALRSYEATAAEC